jgi:hypothetical protein
MVWEEAFNRPPLCVWIMMGYSEEMKTYQLFDLVKGQIIIRRNVWFDKKSSRINLLNASS